MAAALAAKDMQTLCIMPGNSTGVASHSEEEEHACIDCIGGVWGRSPADTSSAPSVSDEDLQAQAWFPGILTSMLHCAETAANVVLNESGAANATTSFQHSHMSTLLTLIDYPVECCKILRLGPLVRTSDAAGLQQAKCSIALNMMASCIHAFCFGKCHTEQSS